MDQGEVDEAVHGGDGRGRNKGHDLALPHASPGRPKARLRGFRVCPTFTAVRYFGLGSSLPPSPGPTGPEGSEPDTRNPLPAFIL
jgi:hypothetical protein